MVMESKKINMEFQENIHIFKRPQELLLNPMSINALNLFTYVMGKGVYPYRVNQWRFPEEIYCFIT